MPIDPDRVAAASLAPFTGQAWRQLGPRHSPLSGEGARLHGGRFNPPESFPVLYLCRSRSCADGELKRMGERQSIGLAGLLPRRLYRYEVSLFRVLDLTDEVTRRALDIERDVLVRSSWSECQDLGTIAHSLGIQAINSPSATEIGEVLAVLRENVEEGNLKAIFVDEWREVDDMKS